MPLHRYASPYVGLLLCCLAVQWPRVLAGDMPGESSAASISGSVVDAEGGPTAGATVWLTRANFPQQSEVLQTVTADAAGRFTLRDPTRDEKPNRWLTLAARDAKGRLGGANLPPSGDPAGQAIRIKLCEVQDYRGQLTDIAGRPIAKVPLRLMRLGAVLPGRSAERRPIGVAPELAADLGGRTADDGSFVLRGVPLQGDIMVEAVAPAFGSPWVYWQLSKSVTIRLDRAGSVAGSVSGPAGAEIAGVKVSMYFAWSRDEFNSDYSLSWQQDTRTEKDGAFRFSRVPSMSCRVRAESDERSEYAAADSPTFKVKPGKEATVALSLRRLIAVRGKVVDRETKAGVAGVTLQFYTMSEKRDIQLTRYAKSNAQGDYSLRVLPGQVCGYVERCPEAYTVPDPGPGLRRDPLTNDSTWPVIELERGMNVEGIVVDAAGQPAAEATAYFIGAPSMNRVETAKCDPAGKFVLKQLPTSGTISVQARTDSAATEDPATVALGVLKGPLRLAVFPAASLRGVLVDDVGQPVHQAEVYLNGWWSTGSRKWNFHVASGRSDAQGRFEIRGLWPGEYDLHCAAGTSELQQRPKANLRSGESLDLGKIVLDSARRTIEGSVLDSAGKPLVGVEIFNSGDAPGRLSARTDAAGRFRLQGFRSGPAYLFAQRPGYRFQAVLAKSGATDVTIRLLRGDEPLPPRPPSKRLSDEQRRALARAVLDRFWAGGDRTKMDALLFAMALVDLPKAQQWAAGRGPEVQDALRVAAAMRMADIDLEEVLGLLPPDAPRAVGMILHIAQRWAADQPEKALRLTEEGIVRARGCDAGERAEALAAFGSLVVRLGQPENGRKLIEEAAEIAARLPLSIAESITVGLTGVGPHSSIWVASRQTGWAW